MIAAHMKETVYRVRWEAAHIDRQLLFVFLIATFLTFACAFEIGRATRTTSAHPKVETSSELSAASARAEIPASLSAVPPIAALSAQTATGRARRASPVAIVATPSPAPVVVPPPAVAVSPALQNPSPAPTGGQSPAPSPAPTGGQSPGVSVSQPSHRGSPPSGGSSSGSGGRGSFDSSG
jgi:hypothetical protein